MTNDRLGQPPYITFEPGRLMPAQDRPAHRRGWRWVFLDTEFIEHPPQDGIPPTVDLVSVGAVDVDTAEAYYAVVDDPDLDVLLDRPFLRDHVAPHLPWRPAADEHPAAGLVRLGGGVVFDDTHPDVRPRKQIAAELADFLGTPDDLIGTRIFANYGAYDYIVVQWLFGGAAGKPSTLPWHFDDLQTWLWANDTSEREPDVPRQQPDEAHHALADAVHGARVLRWVDTTVRHLRYRRMANEPGF